MSARDADVAQNGAPFHLSTPCGGGCPCDENPSCEFFHFEFRRSEFKSNQIFDEALQITVTSQTEAASVTEVEL